MSGSLFPSEAETEALLPRPGSPCWSFCSDPRLYLVMLYPLLLQVAHPTVGAGVRDFSDFERRPWQRLLRSLDWVTLLVYGGQDAAAAGRRLRALHKEFRGVREDGRRYYALEPSAYAWVHATLLDSYVCGHAHFGRPMTADQRECFYTEYRALGRLAGVRPRDLPQTWAGFRDYFETTMREELVRNDSTERVLGTVQGSPPPPVPLPEPLWRSLQLPARRALWLGGVGLLPPFLRARLGIEWSGRDELALRGLGASSRALTPLLPARLRVLGPAQLRLRRRAIMHGPLGSQAETTSAPLTSPDADPPRRRHPGRRGLRTDLRTVRP